MPRAKLRTPALEAEILRAATSVLATEGPGGFTTRKVAAAAGTSTAAVYELYGDRAGLLRRVFFEGFRRLADAFAELEATDDPRADVAASLAAYRRFSQDHPVLAELMFQRPFTDFAPGPDDLAAGAATYRHIMDRVRRCHAAGLVRGDPVDVAHVLLALAQGLARQEAAGWIGSPASADRRWDLAVAAVFDGL